VRGLKVSYDSAKGEFSFTNTQRIEAETAGMQTLPPARRRPVKGNGFCAVPAESIDGQVKLRVLVDRASLELFVNDGLAAASFVVVPAADNRTIRLEGKPTQKITSITVNELKSAWEAAK